MTPDEAIAFVRGMLKSVKPHYRDDDANAWARRIDWFAVIKDAPDGEMRDYREPDWTVQVEKLPDLIEAARTDGAAFETAQRLACAYLRWNRPLPPVLAQHVISRLTGSARKPHRKKSANQTRDEMAVVSIKYLQEKASILPDRNDELDRKNESRDRLNRPVPLCGIQIVTDALRDAGYTATYSAIKSAFYRNRDSL